ncbi:hypothetical protein LEP1GSC096_2084 [Leptospira interrogans serovar Hebdomadis str. R499]|uniref:hypothetical protein n=1 Tax=Leptospira interrogans TaxID=173 RepID=UPI000297449E|nr:hypothetical protein [Leptospira interrogans]EKR33921.1 hypothetical protein LEP1GSC096_2084 [Leptospira interrogans serovar Hebdomadis str. R499]
MSNRLTLEGDNDTLPEDFRLIKVYGKYIPKTESNGELYGDLYVERIDGYSPALAQLNGLDDSKHSEFFGTFIHDNAIPIMLSGEDELGRFGALFKGFKFKAPKMPVLRGFKMNTKRLTRGISNVGKSIGKVGKEVQKGAKNYVKAHQKAFKDISKGAGKLIGQVAEGGMGLLQSMGQQGQEQAEEQPEELDETQNYEDSSYPEETYSEEPEEIPTDESIEEGENLEEVNGELGFLPQAMMAAGTAGQLFNSFNSMQQTNAAAKHARSMDKLNAFASILRPQQTKTAPKKMPAPKKAVSNSSFANPKLAQTPEGSLKLSYSNRNLDNATDSGGGSADKKDDKNLMYYIGAGIAALGLVFIMNKKGR